MNYTRQLFIGGCQFQSNTLTLFLIGEIAQLPNLPARNQPSRRDCGQVLRNLSTYEAALRRSNRQMKWPQLHQTEEHGVEKEFL